MTAQTEPSRAPVRVQRRRTKGWRKPDGVVYVGRGSKWGNPFGPLGSTQALARVPAVVHAGQKWEHEGRISADGARHDFHHPGGAITVCHVRYMTAREAVDCYLALLCGDRRWPIDFTHTGLHYPHIKNVGELAGLDLMCWCPLDQPCHADVLLALANPPDHECDGEDAWCWPCEYRERVKHPLPSDREPSS